MKIPLFYKLFHPGEGKQVNTPTYLFSCRAEEDVLKANYVIFSQEKGPFNYLNKLSNIALPVVVGQQQLNGILAKRGGGAVILGSQLFQQSKGKRGNVPLPFT